MQLTLSTIIPILLSLIALAAPGILKRDTLADWQNGLIAGVTVAAFASLTVWSGGHITNNLAADWTLFATAYSAALAGPLAPLDSYLQSNLNLHWLKPAPVTPAPLPTPVAIPLPSNVPPRASAPTDAPTSPTQPSA